MSTNYTQDQIAKSILKNGVDILTKLDDAACFDQYRQILSEEKLHYPIPDPDQKLGDWLIPRHYQNLDIEGFLLDQCPKENYDRLILELELYRKYSMLDVLRAMKYLVDLFRSRDIVWGVGRGSSVASYVLFLIGVHRIDSVKYKLPIEEFFKGDQNG
jgi:DNA polymerase III alpha subunit